ncbi:hypothetical protein KP509_02G075800 [Ceratopteris richardii]|uniref:Autophagy protein ATG5 UblA domain-containing protein n=1 Tax=Ceratopteris richardii TaxID=49495 RepID=A0A8T2VBA3_CERRI|nr:hypothetical protein KP509_02G075800 [Ceratopteris richardii]
MICEDHSLIGKVQYLCNFSCMILRSQQCRLHLVSCVFLDVSTSKWVFTTSPAVYQTALSKCFAGQDTGWFEYERLSLKWHVPTGVLYDLLCFEPARPWNLMEK